MTEKMNDSNAAKILRIAKAQQFKCILCGLEMNSLNSMTVEHIIPQSEKHHKKHADNKAISHYMCNNIRGALPLILAMKYIKQKISFLKYRGLTYSHH